VASKAPVADRMTAAFSMNPTVLRPLAGLTTVLTIAAIVAIAVTMFRGGFAQSVPLTVISPRAGLIMNPDAKVKLLGVPVGRVASVEALPSGQASLHLDIEPAELSRIPANVLVDIAPATVFGAKSVELVLPADPSPQSVQSGQVLDAGHVTVEFNTIFEQLTTVLSSIQPDKLNETLGGISSALNGRGEKIGNALADLDTFLTRLDPSLPSLNRDFELAPAVLNAYADAAPNVTTAVGNTTRISKTIVDEQQDLDTLLVGTIGLADIGNDVIGTNRQPLTDLLHLLVPTTELTNQYNSALHCGLAGLYRLSTVPPSPVPGELLSVGLTLGKERYRYPSDLPKVAATGGPHCVGLPDLPMNSRPPFIVPDDGANPWQYGNQGILLNSDGLKQFLFGPIDGPPRNGPQIGQPG
jgi:phospholipid/cholesterol/gamma-HCH transport system substrate-binding protein